jgi:hypothetical protein
MHRIITGTVGDRKEEYMLSIDMNTGIGTGIYTDAHIEKEETKL